MLSPQQKSVWEEPVSVVQKQNCDEELGNQGSKQNKASSENVGWRPKPALVGFVLGALLVGIGFATVLTLYLHGKGQPISTSSTVQVDISVTDNTEAVTSTIPAEVGEAAEVAQSFSQR